MLFDTVRGAVTRVDSDWSFLLFLIPFTLLFCGVFFASGYLLLCGRYRYFGSIWVVLAAFGVFGLISGVPRHVQNLFSLQSTDWRMGLLQTIFLFAAFYVARWFLHATYRLLPREPHHAIPMA
ncbi:MAG: hypothetical protein JWL59_3677 [Chthoniobacteraceae bacterium]|nr:hypothetical protein [Chthoniobacteraceae bacterium]